MSDKASPVWFSVLKILVGLFFTLVFGALLLSVGHQGLFESGLSALLMGLSVRLVAANVMRLAGRPLTARTRWAVVLGLFIVAASTGPWLSAASHRSTERTEWALCSDSKNLADWNRYLATVPERFRRAETMPRYFLTRALVHAAANDVAGLRRVLNEIATRHKGDAAFTPARNEVTAGLSRMYKTALARLATKAGTADARLQQVFAKLLDDLSTRDDGKVYLLFSNAAELSDSPRHQQALTRLRRQPDVLVAFPAGDAPVLEPGEAFSPSYNSRRRSTFVAAMKEAFGVVFSKGLLDLVPLPEKDDPLGKWILLVDSRIVRTSGFYTHTRQEALAGLLFGLEVNWRFLVIDREGQQLYATSTRSIPAENVRWRAQGGDPSWSPYSIMMDSAYYNYGRQVIARFGLDPPPEKTRFDFTSGEPAAPPAPARASQ